MNNPRVSLKRNNHVLADADTQWQILEQTGVGSGGLVPFQQKLEESHLFPLRPLSPTTLQVNLGKMCNQVCKHCHVDAGPDRKEIMPVSVMQQCLEALRADPGLQTVDLTGGAPEMNPDFRWFVTEIKALNRHVIVRCNLTIILANPRYHDLPDFYAQHGIEVVSSLPFYAQDRTDKQRGDGVFVDSIKALQMLNAVGYGQPDSGLQLHLVYNPAGAFMPPDQASLELQYKKALQAEFGIVFNNLFAITNLPISRFLDYLLQSGNYESYMTKLTNAYNPRAAENVMCRTTISVGWDGYLYDCDFNQMLELKVDAPANHIGQLRPGLLQQRAIVVGQHCFGCTAGAGSSCGGAVA